MFKTLPFITVVSLLLLAAGCSDADETGGSVDINAPGNVNTNPTGNTPVTNNPSGATLADIQTTVSAAQVTVGGTTTVTCQGFDSNGQAIALEDATVSVTPATGTTLTDMVVTFSDVGSYQVACESAGMTGNSVTVQVSPEKPAKVTATVQPSTIAAGGAANVTCTAEDGSGSPLNAANAAITVSPTGATVNGTQVTSTVMGDYTVTCTLDGVSGQADLEVTISDDATFTLLVSPDKEPYDVGDVMTVSGVLKDQYNNTESVEVAGLQVSPVGNESYPNGTTNKVSFNVDGIYTLNANKKGDASMTASVDVIVDTFGPQIDITKPERGTTVEGAPVVDLIGNISDVPGGLVGEPGDYVLVTLGDRCGSGTASGACAEGFECRDWPSTSEKYCFNEVSVDGKGDFSVAIDLAYGVNHLTVVAEDVYGHVSSSTTAVVWSSAYYKASTLTQTLPDVENGVTMQLSQAFMDDDIKGIDNVDGEAEAEGTVDDMADILEVLLSNLDFADLASTPVLADTVVPYGDIPALGDLISALTFWLSDEAGLTLKVTVDDIQMDDVGIDMTLNDGSLTVTFTATNILATLGLDADALLAEEVCIGLGTFCVDFGDVVLDGQTAGTLSMDSLELTSTLELSLAADGQVVAVATDNAFNIGQFDSAFDPFTLELISDSGAAEDLCNSLGIQCNFALDTAQIENITDQLLGTVQQLENAFELLFPTILEYGIGDMLSGIASTLAFDQELQLDAGQFVSGMSSATFNASGELTSLDITEDYMLMGLTAGAESVDGEAPYPSAGSVDFQGCADPTLPGIGEAGVKLGLHDDMMNQLMYALWTSNLLDIQLDQAQLDALFCGPEEDADETGCFDLPVDIALSSLALDPRLPLVYNGCGGTLTVQIGDLFMDTSFDFLGATEVGVWLNGNITVQLTASTTETGLALGLEVIGYDDMMIDVETNKGLLEGDDEALKAFLADEMLPQIFDELLADLSVIELPNFDLGALDATIPAGTEVKFDLDSITHGPEVMDGQSLGNAYTVIVGDL